MKVFWETDILTNLAYRLFKLGFCIFPLGIGSDHHILKKYFNEYNIDLDECYHFGIWENQRKLYKDEILTEYKIPFISHTVWVTSPQKPREIFEV